MRCTTEGQYRKQWLGHCVLAACSRGYQIFQEQGIIKCRPTQPAINYDRDYVDEMVFLLFIMRLCDVNVSYV